MTDTNMPNQITAWGLDAVRPSTFEEKDFWPRQSEPSASQRRLWKRYISSQFIRYGRFWRQSPCSTMREETKASEGSSLASPSDNIISLIRRLPRGKRRLLCHTHLVASDSAIWKACRSKRAITIASDGGLKEKYGTFGWQIRFVSDEVLAEGAGPVDGPLT